MSFSGGHLLTLIPLFQSFGESIHSQRVNCFSFFAFAFPSQLFYDVAVKFSVPARPTN